MAGLVQLQDATLHWPRTESDSVVDGRKFCFSVQTAQRRWFFQAASTLDMRDWLEAVHAHIQYANRAAAAAAEVSDRSSRAAELAATAAGSGNGSGARFDLTPSAMGNSGTDAGSETFEWKLDQLAERSVPAVRWPAGAAYDELVHTGTVIGVIRKLSKPASSDVERLLSGSGKASIRADLPPPFCAVVLESPQTQV